MEKIIENNQVTISGELVSNFEFDHELHGKGFYSAKIKIQRRSDKDDILPIMVSERLVAVNEEWAGQYIRVSGNFRSYNKRDGRKTHLILHVFVRSLEVWAGDDGGCEEPIDENKIFIDGYICKEPIYRTTPKGREITDALIAVNRPYEKSDYLPCIFWGNNAKYTGTLEVGTHIKASGRVQSREYQKMIAENEYETRTAYEVSISSMEVIEDEQDVVA